MAVSLVQQNWRFCNKCFGLWFNGHPKIKGVCPAGGVHEGEGQSGNYFLQGDPDDKA
jgi:hypothetical protein